MQFHTLADLFPLIEGAEFDELVASIKVNGLREAITIYNGVILDGRNRYRACVEAGVVPRFEEFSGTDIHAFVADKNIHRRHLKESQRALIGAAMATAKQGENLMKSSEAQIWTSCRPPTIARAASLMNVSKGSINQAKVVLARGTKDEIAAVRDGKAMASTIAKQIMANVPAEQRHLGGRNSPIVQLSQERKKKAIRMKQQVWNEFRAILIAFGNMPQPADVVSAARAMDRGGLVNTRLELAIKWLEEFSNEWNNRSETVTEDAGTNDDYLDTGTGDTTS